VQTTIAEAGQLQRIPLDQIDVPKRPARRFLGDIAALAESMQDYGLQQPISVREANGRYQLTSGLRRFSAAQMLGWPAISAFVRNVSADDAYVLDLVENLQREDLSPEEEADALGELLRGRGWTLEQVASAIKRSVAYVSKRVRVFEDPTLRDAITRRGLRVSTAEELLAVDSERRPSVVERAIAERWDQTLAREAAVRREPGLRELALLPAPGAEQESATALARPRSRGAPPVAADVGGQRPPGFTRAVREFHRMVLAVRIEDLSQADKAALRALFRDLVMLARATTNQRARVFPPLPTAPTASRRRARA
jgi:ParB/RepB/Spo0J family partition protein